MVPNLSNLIGMVRIRSAAKLYVTSCERSGRTFPHTLIFGLGGCGKTALARAISNDLHYHFVEVHGSDFKKREDIVETLQRYTTAAQSQRKPLLLFIDEVHQLRICFQEALYTPMKEWRLTTLTGDISISPFTLIVATTRFDMLDANSFLTRFPNMWEVTRYSESDITCMVAQFFRRKNMIFSSEITQAIASRSLGVPRNAINLSAKVELSVIATGGSEVTMAHVWQIIGLEELDYLGLSPVYLRYMQILGSSKDDQGKNSPIGVGAIAAKMRQNVKVVEDSIEPILLEFGFVAPTPRGRKITDCGLEYLRSKS